MIGYRWGYKHVEELADVVAQYKAADIPLEVMWTDIDYMDGYRDFSLDPKNFSKDKMQASCLLLLLRCSAIAESSVTQHKLNWLHLLAPLHPHYVLSITHHKKIA